MISLELSTIQHNYSAQAMLDAAKADFLAHGGHIHVVDLTASTDRSTLKYGYAGPESALMGRVKALTDKDLVEVERIRAMATTMTMRDVIQATGMGRSKLRIMASNYEFKFQSGAAQRAEAIHNFQVDPEKDARNVERLKAFFAAGLSRPQAARHMGVSMTLVRRLIAQYQIDYPVKNS